MSSNGAHVSQRIHLLHCDRHAKALNVVAPHVHNFTLFSSFEFNTKAAQFHTNRAFLPARVRRHVSLWICSELVSAGTITARACSMRNGPARLPLVFSLCHGPRRRRRRCQFYNSVKGKQPSRKHRVRGGAEIHTNFAFYRFS